eukprot:5973261-Prymnesium_polylepis.1
MRNPARHTTNHRRQFVQQEPDEGGHVVRSHTGAVVSQMFPATRRNISVLLQYHWHHQRLFKGGNAALHPGHIRPGVAVVRRRDDHRPGNVLRSISERPDTARPTLSQPHKRYTLVPVERAPSDRVFRHPDRSPRRQWVRTC